MELVNYTFKLPDICHGKQFWELAGSGLIKRLLKMDKSIKTNMIQTDVIDLFLVVLRPARAYFSRKETSSLPVKCAKYIQFSEKVDSRYILSIIILLLKTL